MRRRPTTSDNILALLSDGREHTTWELLRVAGSGFNQRIQQLRARGYDIPEPRRAMVDGRWLNFYVLLSRPGTKPVTEIEAGAKRPHRAPSSGMMRPLRVSSRPQGRLL